MKGVPQAPCSFSGFPPYTRCILSLKMIPGLILFFLCSKLGGLAYFDSVNCSANIAMMTFHAPWFRAKFSKLGMVCLAGPPNIAKTNSLKVAMHMASSSNYFFSMKVKMRSF